MKAMYKKIGLLMVAILVAVGVSAQPFACGGYLCEVVEDDTFGPSAKIVGLAVDAEALIDDGVLALPDKVSDGEAEYAVVEIGGAVFGNQLPVKRLILPEYLLKTGDFNFGGELMVEVVFNERLREIGIACFNGMSNLQTIDFPDSLEIIGEMSFRALGVVSLRLPENYTYSMDNCFQEMPNVMNIDFNNLHDIGAHDYVDLPVIERIELPCRVFSGMPALYNLPALKEIVLPEEIGSSRINFFSGCPNVERIYARAVMPLDIDCLFGGSHGSTAGMDYANVTLYVPVGSKDAYMADPMWNIFGHIEEYELAGVETVGKPELAVNVSGNVLTVCAAAGEHVTVADVNGVVVLDTIVADGGVSTVLQKGFYVVRCAGAARTVVVK